MTDFKLDQTFVEKYKDLAANFGFNGVGELTYYRTYSRLKPDGNNEQWFETVERVVNGIYSIQKAHILSQDLGWNDAKAQESAQEMYERMFTFKFLPPGRGLWACGTDIIKKGLGAAMNNCFSGDTLFVTKEGLKSLEDCQDEQVYVLNKDKKYVPAQVNSFGKQWIQEVTFKPFGLRSNLELTVKCTQDHTWILSDKTRTTDLKLGDKIEANPDIYADPNTKEYKTGYAHGLIFGDGTRHTYYPERHTIEVCDGKADYYEPILRAVDGFLTRTDGGRYPRFTILRKNENWKALPVDKSATYYAGFIAGWLAADSHAHKNSTCLDTQNEEAANWLVENCVYGGYAVTGLSYEYSDTNFGKRKNRLCRVSLTTRPVVYHVTHIEALKFDEVFCVTEPETSSFTLASGLLTGNCGFVSTKDIDKSFSKPFTFMMDMSMLGVGVGFDLKGAGKLIVRKPATASPKPYQIPDTREGWVESLKLLLEAYTDEGVYYDFDYSLVRKAGEPIKTFGGVSSGPGPLKEMHHKIRHILINMYDRPLTETDIADIMNLIGVCVVSGNVRRSAQIMFGEPDSVEYLDLKNYDVNPHRAAYGWTSNNSVICDENTNYDEAARRTAINGEPGYFWLANAQNYGRMCEAPNYKDIKVVGCNPCAEQSLENFELCCLVETFPANHETLEDYQRTLKFAYLYAKSVTLLKTHNKDTNRVLLRNRRIGLSQSGIVQFLETHSLEEYRTWCDTGYKTVQKYDEIYSNWLCIPKSIKTTSIKPSGTVSLLVGATPGMHHPEDDYYIRRLRISAISPLLEACKNAGYHIEPDVKDPKNTMVVSIPVEVGCKTIKQTSIWEQVALAAFIQKWWADNQVSCTVTFRPEEAKEIPAILKYYQYDLKAISFLPATELGAYEQMPYEAITKAKYDRLVAKLKPLVIQNLHQDSKPELYCDSSTCQLK